MFAFESIWQDQGWGNTGHSKVSLVLESCSGELKSEIVIFTALHEPTEGFVTCDTKKDHTQFLSDICIGDRISIYAVSAPYPGYECIVSPNAKLTIRTTPCNWDRRKYALLFLYFAAFQRLGEGNDGGCLDVNVQELGTEEQGSQCPATFKVLSNMDICREIILFL